MGSTVVNWGPVILWMLLIFTFSTESFSSGKSTPFLAPLLADLLPHGLARHMETIVYLIRKLGHWSEYFILCILLMRALKAHISRQPAHSAGWSGVSCWPHSTRPPTSTTKHWYRGEVPTRSTS